MFGVQALGISQGVALATEGTPTGKAGEFMSLLKESLLGDGGRGIPYFDLVVGLSLRYGVHPALVLAVVKAESGFNPLALSPKGAMGLMQLMPETAQELGVREPFDPYQNLEAGIRYLKRLLERFGDPLLALAAYNCGPQRVILSGGIPPIPETVAFVRKVAAYFQEFLGLLQDAPEAKRPPRETGPALQSPAPVNAPPAGEEERDVNKGMAEVLPAFRPERSPSKHVALPLQVSRHLISGGRSGFEASFFNQREGPLPKQTEVATPPEGSAGKEVLTAPFGHEGINLSQRFVFEPKGPMRVLETEDKGGGSFDLLTQGMFKEGVFTQAVMGGERSLSPSEGGVRFEALMEEVVERVKIEWERGAEKVEVEVKPLVLGGMKVEIKREAGGITAHITAYTEGTRRVLEAHLYEVQKAFEVHGLKVSSVTIGLGEMGEASRRYGQRERQRQQEERRPGLRKGDVFEVMV